MVLIIYLSNAYVYFLYWGSYGILWWLRIWYRDKTTAYFDLVYVVNANKRQIFAYAALWI